MATVLRDPDVSLPERPVAAKPLHVAADGVGEVTSITGVTHVMSLTEQSPDPYPHPQQCRIVYFFAKRPVRTEFAHPINIKVEMFFGDYQGVKNTIPIVIDPDVRYPGGSGVDGGSP